MRTLLLYSGGADSTLLLYRYRPAACLFFRYGQNHLKEVFYAQDHCGHLGIPMHEVTLPTMDGSSLTGGSGSVVVPARNLAFLAIAANFAEAHGFDRILIGANGDDAADFPDCRVEFYLAVQGVFVTAGLKVEVQVPLLGSSKGDILKGLNDFDVALSETWSCYEGGEMPCGECKACKLRHESLERIQV